MAKYQRTVLISRSPACAMIRFELGSYVTRDRIGYIQSPAFISSASRCGHFSYAVTVRRHAFDVDRVCEQVEWLKATR